MSLKMEIGRASRLCAHIPLTEPQVALNKSMCQIKNNELAVCAFIMQLVN